MSELFIFLYSLFYNHFFVHTLCTCKYGPDSEKMDIKWLATNYVYTNKELLLCNHGNCRINITVLNSTMFDLFDKKVLYCVSDELNIYHMDRHS